MAGIRTVYCAILCLLLSATSTVCQSLPIITVIAHRDGKPDLPLTDLLVAKLTASNKVVVVERQQLTLLLHELALTAEGEEPAARLLGAEFAVVVERSGDILRVRIVRLRTGSILGEERFAADGEDLLEHILAAIESAPPPSTTSVAIAPLETEDPQAQHAAEAIFRFRSALPAAGFALLEREAIAPIHEEHLLSEGGFTAPLVSGLQGVRFLLMPFWNSRNLTLELSALDVTAQRRVGAVSLHLLPDTPHEPAVNTLLQWLKDLEISAEIVRSSNGATPEAVRSLAAAMQFLQSGDYFSALSHLTFAAEQDPKSSLSRQLSLEIYRQLGFAELADGTQQCERAHEVSQPSGQGSVFVGMRGAPTLNRRAAELRLLRHLVAQRPILLTDDLARLSREYDFLVGMNSINGSTWSNAGTPSVGSVIGADISGEEKGFTLWEIPLSLPLRTRRTTVNSIAASSISDAVKELSQQDYHPLTPAEGTEKTAVLSSLLDRSLTHPWKVPDSDLLYLQLLRAEPRHMRYLSQFPRRATNRRCLRPALLQLRGQRPPVRIDDLLFFAAAARHSIFSREERPELFHSLLRILSASPPGSHSLRELTELCPFALEEFVPQCIALIRPHVSSELRACPTSEWKTIATLPLSKKERAELLLPHSGACIARWSRERKTAGIVEQAYRWAQLLIETEQPALAEPLLRAILSWRTERGTPPDPELQTGARFLLAYLLGKDGDLQRSLAEARLGLEETAGRAYYLVDLSGTHPLPVAHLLSVRFSALVDRLRFSGTWRELPSPFAPEIRIN